MENKFNKLPDNVKVTVSGIEPSLLLRLFNENWLTNIKSEFESQFFDDKDYALFYMESSDCIHYGFECIHIYKVKKSDYLRIYPACSLRHQQSIKVHEYILEVHIKDTRNPRLKFSYKSGYCDLKCFLTNYKRISESKIKSLITKYSLDMIINK